MESPKNLNHIGLVSSQSQEEASDENLISLTYSNKLVLIQEYLQNHPNLDITSLRSANQYSLLHIAVVNNQLTLCKIFLRHLKNQNLPYKNIKKWVNLRTQMGHTSIHFASLNGNLELINLLEEYEADIYIKDYDGLDVMHFAAQGDQCLCLVYFNGRGLSIHEKDTKGRMPLHIAAAEGMENAVNYLTSRECFINAQDFEVGYTPLHCAILSSNFKVVRRLLVKGADPNIRNKKGESSFELAQRCNNMGIVKILRKKTWLNKLLGLRQGLPQGPTWYTFALFFFFYITVVAIQVLFVFPFIEDLFWFIGFLVLIGLLLALFIVSWLKSPGDLKGVGSDSMFSLLQKYEPQEICLDCSIRKPIRSRHCDVCQTCIPVYDHHCTWTKNCVGAKNHRYFLCLTLVALIALIFILLMQIVYYRKPFAVFKFMPNFAHATLETAILLKDITCMLTSLIAIMFIIPLIALNYIQLGNFVLGKTTSERFGGQLNQKGSQGSSRESATSEGYFEEKKQSKWSKVYTNCFDMCFRNSKNRRYVTCTSSYEDDILILP